MAAQKTHPPPKDESYAPGDDPQEMFSRTAILTKKLLQVPKDEIDEKIAEIPKRKRSKRGA